MNKKDYSKPSMRVITMRHRIGFICGSGSKSVQRVSSSESFEFAGSMDDTYSDN